MFGKVVKKQGEKWMVTWTIDNSEMAFKSSVLNLEDNLALLKVCFAA